ncbi:MAG: transposase [Desulfovibrio sp.]|nr:transposase [Desulfovibrio sp.]
MYFTYSGKNKDCLTAIGAFRDASGKKKYGVTYIGKRIQDDIFFCKNDGYFRFNIETTEFLDAPDNFSNIQIKTNKRLVNSILSFGDTYLINEFLYKSGFINILKNFSSENFDTLMVLVLSYITTSEPNCDIEIWYENNFIKYLYPNAEVKSQRISEFLAKIGEINNEIAFHKLYKKYLFEFCNLDYNVLIDSTGLKNDICFYYTTFSNNSGKKQNKLRLIFVSNILTGIPIFYKFIPGNILNINSLRPIISQLNELDIKISKFILDAGYNSSDNLDIFYDEKCHAKIECITRLKSNDKNLKEAIKEYGSSIISSENIVRYGERIIYIKVKNIKVGTKNDKPAFLYLCLDVERQGEENSKIMNKTLEDDSIGLNEIHDKITRSGFFGLISNIEYNINEIIKAYYERQSIEQTFDFAKNYTKLLPLRVHKEDTFRGHLLISYIATCIIKIIQIQLLSTNNYLSKKFKYLGYQHCTIYTNTAIVEYPQKEANNLYKLLGIKVPDRFKIDNSILKIDHCIEDNIPTWTKNVKENNTTRRSIDNRSVNKYKNVSDINNAGQSNTIQNINNYKNIENEVKQNVAIKRGRGRPKGSRNKKTLEREASGTVGAPIQSSGEEDGQ